MIKAGIVGSSGFIGSTLMKLLLEHKGVELKIAASNSLAGKKVSEEFPEINTDLAFTTMSMESLNKMDVVFLAVPHGTSKGIASGLKCKVIDMASDHRLTAAYGLPEIYAKGIAGSTLVANPGCYATACILASYPLKGMIDHAVFDCISGYSGGGKANPYDYVENIIAYKLTAHSHVAEIGKALGFRFSFTPHVVNAFSGLMCTAHLFLKPGVDVDIKAIKQKYAIYDGSFTKVVDHIPCTKEVTGTPMCHVGGFEKSGAGDIVIISVIDNLYKGAASQAIENMNLMFGLDHKEGLQ